MGPVVIRSSHICFLCIGFEPGADGIGDYIRSLIEALPSEVTATVIALHDSDVDSPTAEQQERAFVVRIPRAWPTRARYRLAAKTLDERDPDWVSLHFVCWFFGPKGVVLGQSAWLRRLTARRPLEIMFHEPWLRPPRPAASPTAARRWLLGRLQRWSVGRMVRRLRPILTHTSNLRYQQLFAGLGIETRLLPVFGTLLGVPPAHWSDLRQAAAARGATLPGRRDDYLLIGLFGAVREAWDAMPMLAALVAAATRMGRRAVLVQVGRAGPLGQELVTRARTVDGLIVVSLGALPFAELSALLPLLHVGLAHQPPADLGRSTTTAAMLEWGVPVLVSIGGQPLPADPFLAQWRSMLIWPGDTMEAALVAAVANEPAPRRHADPRPRVAARFLLDLREAGNPA